MVWDFGGGGYCCPECGTPFTGLGSDHVTEQLAWLVIVRVRADCRRRYRRAAPAGSRRRWPRRLVISSDFYAVDQSAGKKAGGLVNLYCWAHIRRYFVRAGDANPAQLGTGRQRGWS